MKKNVAIIVQKLHGGGAERAASNLSIALAENYNIHLVVFDRREIKYPYAGTLHDLKMPPKKGAIGKAINMFKRAAAVKKLKKSENIDASISLMDGANLVNVLSKGNDTVFTSIRNQMSKFPKRMRNGKAKRSEKLVMKYLAGKSEKVVAVAKGVEIDMVNVFGVPQEKATTIYNICDGKLLREKAEKHAEDAKAIPCNSITTVGRLNHQKGQWHLLRAFKTVLEKIPDAELYILGEGELEEKLKALSKELGIEQSVHFMGFVEAPHAYIMNSRVFVLPSLFEGMSNVLLEALACGTPCIATDCESGSREVLAPGTGMPRKLDEIEYAEYGVLTSVGDAGHFNAQDALSTDEKQLAEAMAEMLQNEKLRKKYVESAKRRANDFAPEKIAEDWGNLIG